MALLALILLQLAPPDSLLAVMDGIVEETAQLEERPRLRGAGWTTLLSRNSRHDYPNPWGQQLRLWSHTKSLAGTLTLDRDAGEPNRVDQKSGFVTWSPRGVRVTAGTFRVSAGSGGVLGRPRLGTVAQTGARLLRAPGIQGYAGTAAYTQLRGIGAQAASGRLGGWISSTRLDGRLDSMGVHLTRSSSRRTTGELQRRRAIPSRAAGLLFDSRGRGTRIGALLAFEQLAGLKRRAAELFGVVELSGLRAEASVSRCICGLQPTNAAQVRVRTASERGQPLAILAIGSRTRSPRGRTTPAFAAVHLRLPLDRVSIRVGGYQASGESSFHLSVDHERLRLAVDHGIELEETISAVGRAGLTSWTNVPKTRFRLSGDLPQSRMVLSAAQRSGAWSLLVSLATTAAIRGFAVSAGLADFSTEAQAPTMTLYEPVPRHVFPLKRVSGSGRRWYVSVRRHFWGHQVHLFIARETRQSRTSQEPGDAFVDVRLAVGSS